MKATWVIARREFKALVESRAYLFGTVVGLVAILALSFLPALLAGLEAPEATSVAVVDEAGGVFEQLQAVEQQLPAFMRPLIAWEAAGGASGSGTGTEMSPSGEDGRTYLIIRRGPDGELEFVLRGQDVRGSVVRGLQQLATPVAVSDRARRWGIASDVAAALQAPAVVRVEAGGAGPGAGEVPGVATEAAPGQWGAAEALAWLLMFMLYMTLILYGSVVSNGVAAEKGSRIVEMLLVAAKPGELLRGKLLGIAGASLVQYAVWGAAGALAFLMQRGFIREYLTRLVGFPVELGGVPLWLVGYLTLFFLLSFVSFGALFAALASLASRPEEASQTVWPAVTLMVAGYMVAMMALADPASRLAVIGSMLPFVGPMVIYTRIAMASAPAWQVAGSVAVSVVTAWLTLRLAERVYGGSLLQTRRTGWLAAMRQGWVGR